MKLFIIFVIVFAVFFQVRADESRDAIVKQQWDHSAHAGSMNTPEERTRMNKTGCAHCHTAQGYWEVVLEGRPSTAPYKNPDALTCIACHFVDKAGTVEGSKLRAGNVQSACRCHDILVQNDLEDFSHCPQGSLIKGKGGAEFAGETYPAGGHAEIEKNCAGCHMAEPPKGDNTAALGGHSFRVITKGETPRRFNPTGCTGCHENMSYDFVKKSQAEIKILLEQLRDLLPQKPKGTEKRPEERPRFPEDPKLSKTQAMAAFNYYTIWKDGTYGVHNPLYIKKLLLDSMEKLRAK